MDLTLIIIFSEGDKKVYETHYKAKGLILLLLSNGFSHYRSLWAYIVQFILCATLLITLHLPCCFGGQVNSHICPKHIHNQNSTKSQVPRLILFKQELSSTLWQNSCCVFLILFSNMPDKVLVPRQKFILWRPIKCPCMSIISYWKVSYISRTCPKHVTNIYMSLKWPKNVLNISIICL